MFLKKKHPGTRFGLATIKKKIPREVEEKEKKVYYKIDGITSFPLINLVSENLPGMKSLWFRKQGIDVGERGAAVTDQ